jgi:sugar fermentation stimulation protein A
MVAFAYKKPTLQGTLVRRYKRFLADVRLENGDVITVHVPNSGSMKSCSEPSRPVVLTDSENPSRKLRYTLEMIRMGRSWVGVHSALSNQIIAQFIGQGAIEELTGYGDIKREVRYGTQNKSRVDLVLSEPERPPCFVEIKHSTMRVEQHAAFPDAVSERAQKHIREMMHVVEQGHRAVMFIVIGRADCTRFRPADEIDPNYGKLLREGIEAGLEVIPYQLKFSPTRVTLGSRLPMDL